MAFLFLILFIGMIGFWLWSMRDLFGSFGKSLGVFKNAPVQEVSMSFEEKPENNNSFIVEELVHATLQALPTEVPPQIDPKPSLEPPETEEIRIIYPMIQNDEIDIVQDIYNRSAAIYSAYSQEKEYKIYEGKYSYYWPPLGGINCDVVDGREECEYMASGLLFKDYVGIAFACDPSIPMYSVVYVEQLNLWGRCLDRGSMIRQDQDGLFWFDHLIDEPFIPYGDHITVRIYDQK